MINAIAFLVLFFIIVFSCVIYAIVRVIPSQNQTHRLKMTASISGWIFVISLIIFALWVFLHHIIAFFNVYGV